MWSFGDPDRPNLKLMPGLVLYFGWRMRRVRKEGETGPVQLGFKLTQTGNPYTSAARHRRHCRQTTTPIPCDR